MRVCLWLVLAVVLICIGCRNTEDQLWSLDSLAHGTIDLRLEQGGYNVFVFIAPDCPLSKNYTLTIKQINEQFAEQAFNFYGVQPGALYTLEEMEEFCKKYKWPYPVLLDPDYELTRFFGATITPEVFVVDSGRTIHYSGAIDNWAVSLGQQRPTATKHYLADALNALSHNQPVNVKRVDAVGCFIE